MAIWWRGSTGAEFGWGRVTDEEYLRYRFRRELRQDGVLLRERGWQRRYPREGH